MFIGLQYNEEWNMPQVQVEPVKKTKTIKDYSKVVN